jgi:hypothetical protein
MRKNKVKTTRSSTATGVYKNKDLAGTIQARIVSLLGKEGGVWIGNMTELTRALENVSRKTTPENWPTSPSVMRKVINNAVYSIRRSGVRVKFTRTTDHMRKRVVEFTQR